MTAARRFAANFVHDLAALRCPNVFNPYSDVCPNYDRPDAPAARRRNLEAVLESAVGGGVEAMWVGLELGHGGGRRTGLPMTDDHRLNAHSTLFGIPELDPPTVAGPRSEITSAAVWEAIDTARRRVLLWNIFPLHPHKPGLPLSNRRHNAAERLVGKTFLSRLVDELQPTSIIAIGRDSEVALRTTNYDFTAVRHPAYGGKPAFLSGIADCYPPIGD